MTEQQRKVIDYFIATLKSNGATKEELDEFLKAWDFIDKMFKKYLSLEDEND